MLKVENFEVLGWEHVIRGMRNPKNSWAKIDSEPGCEIVEGSHEVCRECDNAMFIGGKCVCPSKTPEYVVGYNDHDLMMTLAKGGPVHGKFRRMIVVYVDITAPLYWWKEFDTYKVGTVANSCSTMHKIHAKEFVLEDFSNEHLINDWSYDYKDCLLKTIEALNQARTMFLDTGEKIFWWQMIQLLPSSYNQKRTVMLNYEVLANIYQYRRNHKLDEWHVLCDWIKTLPYSEIITCNVEPAEPVPVTEHDADRPNGIVRTREDIEKSYAALKNEVIERTERNGGPEHEN